MTRDLPLSVRHAENAAAKIIEKYGICAPGHIRLMDIAYDLGANVQERRLERAAASLVRVGKHATISVAIQDSYERKRFSIAHELGHLVLDHVLLIQRFCSDENMMEWYQTGEETEANFFAAELILPKSLVERRCDIGDVNLEPIRQIAREFRTSLTATAIRFVRFCPEKCAVVFSRHGKIIWSYKSEEWWPFIRRGRVLDKRTVAFDFFQGETIPDEAVDVEADAWVEGRGLDDIIEHSVGSRRLSFVLSILWIKP